MTTFPDLPLVRRRRGTQHESTPSSSTRYAKHACTPLASDISRTTARSTSASSSDEETVETISCRNFSPVCSDIPGDRMTPEAAVVQRGRRATVQRQRVTIALSGARRRRRGARMRRSRGSPRSARSRSGAPRPCEEVRAEADARIRPEVAEDPALLELRVDGGELGNVDRDRSAAPRRVARAAHLEARLRRRGRSGAAVWRSEFSRIRSTPISSTRS